MKIKNLALSMFLILLVIPMTWAATVSVTSAEGAVGDTVTVNVNVDPQGVAEKSGNVILTYDSTKLQYVGTTDVSYFDSKMPVTASNGKVTITQYTVGSAKSTAGLWAKVSFTILTAGTLGFDQANTMWGLNPFTSFTGSTVSTTTCTPSCVGKYCGDDGCGGSCGTCTRGHICTSTGTCVLDVGGCTPALCASEGKECGDWTEPNCGTLLDCGDCGVSQLCENNLCVDVTVPPPVTFCGDFTCNGAETCSSCETDCGPCTQTIGQVLDEGMGDDKTTKEINAGLLTIIVNVLRSWFNLG